MQLGLIGKFRAVLRQDLSTASQTARWIARSATRLKVASNIACVVDAEIEIGTVKIESCRRLLGQGDRQRQKASQSETCCQPCNDITQKEDHRFFVQTSLDGQAFLP